MNNQLVDYRWGFWQISGWYGVWSKYHLIKNGRTACGRFVTPEYGSDIIFKESIDETKHCKICLKITRK